MEIGRRGMLVHNVDTSVTCISCILLSIFAYRLVAEMSAAHWSVQKEVNMTELVEKTRSPPMILTPRNRPKNPRNLDPARWRKTAAKQVKKTLPDFLGTISA